MYACWWQVWDFSSDAGGGGGGAQVCQDKLSLPSFRGRYVSRGGTLGLQGGNSRALGMDHYFSPVGYCDF